MDEDYLNKDLRFAALPGEVKASFIGSARKTTLSPGTVLYHFLWFAKRPTAGLPTGNWISEQIYQRLRELHETTDIPIDEIARGTLAIAYRFTEIVSGVMRARLRRKVGVFVGIVAQQRMFARESGEKPRSVLSPYRKLFAEGGMEQIYIPNIEWSDLDDIRSSLLNRAGASRLLLFKG